MPRKVATVPTAPDLPDADVPGDRGLRCRDRSLDEDVRLDQPARADAGRGVRVLALLESDLVEHLGPPNPLDQDEARARREIRFHHLGQPTSQERKRSTADELLDGDHRLPSVRPAASATLRVAGDRRRGDLAAVADADEAGESARRRRPRGDFLDRHEVDAGRHLQRVGPEFRDGATTRKSEVRDVDRLGDGNRARCRPQPDGDVSGDRPAGARRGSGLRRGHDEEQGNGSRCHVARHSARVAGPVRRGNLETPKVCFPQPAWSARSASEPRACGRSRSKRPRPCARTAPARPRPRGSSFPRRPGPRHAAPWA